MERGLLLDLFEGEEAVRIYRENALKRLLLYFLAASK
jgi:hypothetical protein